MNYTSSDVRPSGLDDHDMTVRLAQASIAPHLTMMIISEMCAETGQDPAKWLAKFIPRYITSSYPAGVGSDVAGKNCYAASLLLQDTQLAMKDCSRPFGPQAQANAAD
jgi:hypothetical protein